MITQRTANLLVTICIENTSISFFLMALQMEFPKAFSQGSLFFLGKLLSTLL